MNRKQQVVLWVGIAAFVLMGFFPPWHLSFQGIVVADGYHFFTYHGPGRVIDMRRLAVQWAVLVAVVGGLLVAFRGSARRTEQKGG